MPLLLGIEGAETTKIQQRVKERGALVVSVRLLSNLLEMIPGRW